MPKPFVKLSLADFEQLLVSFPFTRVINAVHMHHTWKPRRSDFNGVATIDAIYEFHTGMPPKGNGWADIAEHVTIDPEGGIWTGRDWNMPPASNTGSNGTSQLGPFMFEMIGNFDQGMDLFDGPQHDTVIQLIAAVQKRFHLPPETLKFHRQLDNGMKTCPGSGIDYDATVAEVRASAALQAARSADTSAPFARSAAADPQIVAQALLSLLTRVGSRAAEELHEEDMTEEETRSLSDALQGARGLTSRFPSLTPADKQKMRPYVVTMRAGKYADSESDEFPTSAADAAAIFLETLPQKYAEAKAAGRPLRILLYAHGGLVSEAAAFVQIREQLEFWTANNIYPLYFVWETGLLEILSQMIHGQVSRDVDVARRPEWTNEAVAFLARKIGGPRIWSAMKYSAELASRPDGAAYDVARLLGQFLKRLSDAGEPADAVEVHAIGHSAGSTFHANLLPVVLSLGLPKVRTLNFLAPAMRVDQYKAMLSQAIGKGISDCTIFTMFKTYEFADTCLEIYGHSLLLLIYHALEDEKETPILGLEDSLRGDADLRAQFGLGGSPGAGSVVFSVSNTGPRSASSSISHGGFHNDPPTMNSVARRILNNDKLYYEFKPGLSDAQAESMVASAKSPAAAPPFPFAAPSTPASAPASVLIPSTPAPAITPAAGGTGRRLALCVGIDTYPSSPLGGCVADARLWSARLSNLNFTVTNLFNEQADEASLFGALTSLVRSSRAGDTLVFQYSGHGTLLDDPSRPAGDGEIAGHDEAICAYDFADGGFIADRRVGDLFDQLPPGVSLTSFLDCCHSATMSRFAPAPGAKARFVIMQPAWYSRYIAKHPATRALPTAAPFRTKSDMREIEFSACRADEVAYESGGNGHFTLKATAILENAAGRSTNVQFQQAIVAAFGIGAMQHPVLDCSGSGEGLPLLGSAPPSGGGGRGLVAGAESQGKRELAMQLLQTASLLLEPGA